MKNYTTLRMHVQLTSRSRVPQKLQARNSPPLTVSDVHKRVYESPPLKVILSQTKPVHTLMLTMHFSIMLLCTPIGTCLLQMFRLKLCMSMQKCVHVALNVKETRLIQHDLRQGQKRWKHNDNYKLGRRGKQNSNFWWKTKRCFLTLVFKLIKICLEFCNWIGRCSWACISLNQFCFRFICINQL